MLVNATDGTALEARGLTVRYGALTAVDAVSLHGDRGEIVGLLGPNGAGKTSIIRALTTIVPFASGDGHINGYALSDRTAVRASIGVLPESNGYPGAQTGRSYLRFYGQLFGMSRGDAEERAERLLHRMGLGHNHNRIATFSRGMRQRLGLARALMNDPAVLFLDEPTIGLDPAGKEDILAELTRSATEDGTCVILCTHLLDEVERVCDRVAILHHGRIVAEGTVEDVTTAAKVAGQCRVRVAPSAVAAADSALRSTPVVVSTRYDNTRPGDIDIELAREGGLVDGAVGAILRALLDAGIEPRSFELYGGSLSEAFLALTAESAQVAS